jgi:hypothetical protein
MKNILLILLMCFITNLSYSQKNSVNGKFSTKLGFSKNKTEDPRTKLPSFKIEINYGVLHFIEFGCYAGFGWHLHLLEMTNGSTLTSHHFAKSYGVSTNFHLLPFIVKNNSLRFSLYISGKLGGIDVSNKNISPLPNKYFSDYGAYIGTSYFFTKHIGIYGEIGYGSYTQLRYGFALNF